MRWVQARTAWVWPARPRLFASPGHRTPGRAFGRQWPRRRSTAAAGSPPRAGSRGTAGRRCPPRPAPRRSGQHHRRGQGQPTAVCNTMKAWPGGVRASCGPGFMLMVTRSGGGAVLHPSGWSLYPGCGLLPGPVSGQPGFYVRDQREGGVGKPAKLVAVAVARCRGRVPVTDEVEAVYGDVRGHAR